MSGWYTVCCTVAEPLAELEQPKSMELEADNTEADEEDEEDEIPVIGATPNLQINVFRTSTFQNPELILLLIRQHDFISFNQKT